MTFDELAANLLRAMAQGARLRDHRDVDGRKWFEIGTAGGHAQPVPAERVHNLVRLGLIDSNKKFPSATYWLTEAGRKLVQNSGTTDKA